MKELLQQNHGWRVSKPLPPSGFFIKKNQPSKLLAKAAVTVVLL